MTSPPSPPPRPSWHLVWETELDRLELDVALAERMLRSNEPGALPDWAPPVVRVPLPGDLLPRARLLHERQLAVAHALTSRLASTARHQALTDRVRDNLPPEVPVYVDVSA